jgi:hypothetical protein
MINGRQKVSGAAAPLDHLRPALVAGADDSTGVDSAAGRAVGEHIRPVFAPGLSRMERKPRNPRGSAVDKRFTTINYGSLKQGHPIQVDLRQYLEKISPTPVNRDSQGMLHPPYSLKSISTSRLFILREGGPVVSFWNRPTRANQLRGVASSCHD